jgi:hypothetical protein
LKRLFAFLLMLLMGVGSAWAVGTCTVSNVTSTQIAAESNRIPDAETVIVTLTCTADSATGSYPSTTIPLTGYYPASYLNTYNLTGFFLYQVGQTPGSTAPTANYTVTIKDTKGFALDLGLLTSNGSASAAQMISIANATTNYPVVRSGLTVAITGNSVNSAQITLDLIFRAASLSAGVSSGGGGVSTASLPLAITGANIAIAQANSTTNGYLGSADWSTFNGKFNGASCTNDGSGNVTCTSFTTPQLTTPDSQLLRPGSGVANPSFYRGWTGPTNPATEAYSIIMPDAVPTAGQAIVAGVPSGSPIVSQGTWATPLTTSAVVTVAQGGTGLATLTAHAVQVGEGTSTPAQVGPNTATTYPLFSAGSSADPAFRAIAAGDIPATAVPAVAVPTPGASITLTGPSGFAICTTTCTVAVPVPVAGYQFCIMNDDNVSTAITLSALGSSARYENSARTAYGTAGTGTLVVAAAAADMVCIVGRDSTHYFTTTSSGVVTVN